jgi:hypothetical protein
VINDHLLPKALALTILYCLLIILTACAVIADPLPPDSLYQRGQEALACENYIEAIEYLTAYVQQDPKDLRPGRAAEVKRALLLSEEKIRTEIGSQQEKARAVEMTVTVITVRQDTSSPPLSVDTLQGIPGFEPLDKNPFSRQGERLPDDETTRPDSQLTPSAQALHELNELCQRIIQELHLTQTDIDHIKDGR